MSYVSHTKIPEYMQLKPDTKNFFRSPVPGPKSLVEIAGEAVNKLPHPDCWTWTVNDVCDWIENTLQLPQYMECFRINKITGRMLITVDASVLPRMNITDFEHIKIITKGIRDLLKIELESFSRSISLPPRKPLTHFLLYTYRSGDYFDNITRLKVFRIWKMVDEEKEMVTHWDTPEYHEVIIGLSRRGKKVETNKPGKRIINMECYSQKSWERLMQS